MKRCVIIPARYSSSRYPGKPLVPLLGKPLVLWVAELSAVAVGVEHVYVATDDVRIRAAVEKAGFNVVTTSEGALTGTDRVAEAALQLDYDIFVNVQGDEPLVEPSDILRVADCKADNIDSIINGFCWLSPEEDPKSHNIPKIVASESGRLIYISRAALPAFKDAACAPTRYMKQVCIYAFTREELMAFRAFGRKSRVEACEDIEILRFFELGRQIMLVETAPGSLAVDVPEDVRPVEAALRRRHRV